MEKQELLRNRLVIGAIGLCVMTLFSWVGLVVHIMTTTSYKPEDPHTKIVKLYDGYRFSDMERELAEVVFLQAGLGDHNWYGNQLQIPAHKKNTYTLTTNRSFKPIRDEIEACRNLAQLDRNRRREGFAWCGTGLDDEAWIHLKKRMRLTSVEKAEQEAQARTEWEAWERSPEGVAAREREEHKAEHIRRAALELSERAVDEHESTKNWARMETIDRERLVNAVQKVPLTELERILEARRNASPDKH